MKPQKEKLINIQDLSRIRLNSEIPPGYEFVMVINLDGTIVPGLRKLNLPPLKLKIGGMAEFELLDNIQIEEKKFSANTENPKDILEERIRELIQKEESEFWKKILSKILLIIEENQFDNLEKEISKNFGRFLGKKILKYSNKFNCPTEIKRILFPKEIIKGIHLEKGEWESRLIRENLGAILNMSKISKDISLELDIRTPVIFFDKDRLLPTKLEMMRKELDQKIEDLYWIMAGKIFHLRDHKQRYKIYDETNFETITFQELITKVGMDLEKDFLFDNDTQDWTETVEDFNLEPLFKEETFNRKEFSKEHKEKVKKTFRMKMNDINKRLELGTRPLTEEEDILLKEMSLAKKVKDQLYRWLTNTDLKDSEYLADRIRNAYLLTA